MVKSVWQQNELISQGWLDKSGRRKSFSEVFGKQAESLYKGFSSSDPIHKYFPGYATNSPNFPPRTPLAEQTRPSESRSPVTSARHPDPLYALRRRPSLAPQMADEEAYTCHDYSSDSDSSSDEENDPPRMTLEERRKALTIRIPPLSRDRAKYIPELADVGKGKRIDLYNVATHSAPSSSRITGYVEPDVMIETIEVDPSSDDMDVDVPLAVSTMVYKKAAKSPAPPTASLRTSLRYRRKKQSTFFTYGGSSPLKPAWMSIPKPWTCGFPACEYRASSVEAVKHHMHNFQHGRIATPDAWFEGYSDMSMASDVVMF